MIRKRIGKGEENYTETTTKPPIRTENGLCSIKFKKILIWIVIIYLLPPILVCVVPQITEQMIYSNMIKYFKDDTELLRNPIDKYKLEGTTSFRITCEDVELGLWHVLPQNEISTDAANDNIKKVENQLIKANIVIIYHHGGGMSRVDRFSDTGSSIYKLLQSEGYHTVAFDYRGFGDSSGWPSEDGLVNDSLCVLNWVKKRLRPDARVYFWGHSLGTASSTLAAKKAFDICEDSKSTNCPQIDGLILEGGFTNIRKGADDNALVQNLGYIYPTFVLRNALKIAFKSLQAELAVDTNLSGVKCPVMLLHAEDDEVIPCQHSEDLFNVCKSSSHVKKAMFIRFKNIHHYGHFNLPKAPELAGLLRTFMTKDTNKENFQTVLV